LTYGIVAGCVVAAMVAVVSKPLTREEDVPSREK
jgi:hypothetical protein